MIDDCHCENMRVIERFATSAMCLPANHRDIVIAVGIERGLHQPIRGDLRIAVHVRRVCLENGERRQVKVWRAICVMSAMT